MLLLNRLRQNGNQVAFRNAEKLLHNGGLGDDLFEHGRFGQGDQIALFIAHLRLRRLNHAHVVLFGFKWDGVSLDDAVEVRLVCHHTQQVLRDKTDGRVLCVEVVDVVRDPVELHRPQRAYQFQRAGNIRNIRLVASVRGRDGGAGGVDLAVDLQSVRRAHRGVVANQVVTRSRVSATEPPVFVPLRIRRPRSGRGAVVFERPVVGDVNAIRAIGGRHAVCQAEASQFSVVVTAAYVYPSREVVDRALENTERRVADADGLVGVLGADLVECSCVIEKAVAADVDASAVRGCVRDVHVALQIAVAAVVHTEEFVEVSGAAARGEAVDFAVGFEANEIGVEELKHPRRRLLIERDAVDPDFCVYALKLNSVTIHVDGHATGSFCGDGQVSAALEPGDVLRGGKAVCPVLERQLDVVVAFGHEPRELADGMADRGPRVGVSACARRVAACWGDEDGLGRRRRQGVPAARRNNADANQPVDGHPVVGGVPS